MPNKTVPPACAPTDAEAWETERKLFEGLARVRMFPIDPSGPGQPPGQMLPVSSFLSSQANQPEPKPILASSHPAQRKPTKEEK